MIKTAYSRFLQILMSFRYTCLTFTVDWTLHSILAVIPTPIVQHPSLLIDVRRPVVRPMRKQSQWLFTSFVNSAQTRSGLLPLVSRNASRSCSNSACEKCRAPSNRRPPLSAIQAIRYPQYPVCLGGYVGLYQRRRTLPSVRTPSDTIPEQHVSISTEGRTVPESY